MKKWAIVYKKDAEYGKQGQVAHVYDSEQPNRANFSRDWLDPEITEHVEVPVDSEIEGSADLVAVVNAGQISVEKNDDHVKEKKEKKRDDKLNLLREFRQEKFAELQVLINELALAERSDAAAVKTWRQSILDVTAAYKDHKTNPAAAADLDNLDPASFTWPVGPAALKPIPPTDEKPKKKVK